MDTGMMVLIVNNVLVNVMDVQVLQLIVMPVQTQKKLWQVNVLSVKVIKLQMDQITVFVPKTVNSNQLETTTANNVITNVLPVQYLLLLVKPVLILTDLLLTLQLVHVMMDGSKMDLIILCVENVQPSVLNVLLIVPTVLNVQALIETMTSLTVHVFMVIMMTTLMLIASNVIVNVMDVLVLLTHVMLVLTLKSQ